MVNSAAGTEAQEILDAALIRCVDADDVEGLASLLSQGANAKNFEYLAFERGASQGRLECLRKLLTLPIPADACRAALALAIRAGHGACAEILIPRSNLEASNGSELRLAAASGLAGCVELMIGRCSKIFNSEALLRAASNGHADCLSLLIPASDPTVNDSKALAFAASNGHADCVRLLIPVSDVLADHSIALFSAALNGQAECLRLLIPFSDPKAGGSRALYGAAASCQSECVALLIPVSDMFSDGASALKNATLAGSLECVKLLAPRCASLLSDPLPFFLAIEEGHAAIVQFMITQEPPLEKLLDFPGMIAKASLLGHGELADFLLSLSENRAISASVPPLAEAWQAPPRRL